MIYGKRLVFNKIDMVSRGHSFSLLFQFLDCDSFKTRVNRCLRHESDDECDGRDKHEYEGQDIKRN